MKKYSRILLTAILGMAFCALFSMLAAASEQFEMHVLDVGQGQGVLFECGGHHMLFDGGGRGSSSFTVSYLKQQGIEKLDYVAVSHYEEDHMSGVIGALSVFPCDMLLLPSYTGEGPLYDSLAEAAVSNGCGILHPEHGYEFFLDKAMIRIIGPQRSDYSSDNNMSLCLKVTYGDFSAIICGDAEKESENDLAASGENLRSDVYVVNHHGSSTSSTEAFIESVSPAYAVISCGKDNSYGHPSAETLQRLKDRGISLFRTDMQGTVIIYSDGSDIWFSDYPTDNWEGGSSIMAFGETAADSALASPLRHGTEEMLQSSEETRQYSEDAGAGYVCNINTKKFHYPDCKSVSQMKEENRLYTEMGRDELLSQGYEPCGSCRP